MFAVGLAYSELLLGELPSLREDASIRFLGEGAIRFPELLVG